MALCWSAPLVPVTVKVEVPAATPNVVFTVRVEVPEPLNDGGFKIEVAPAGKPETARLITPVKPFLAVAVMLYDLLLPAVTV